MMLLPSDSKERKRIPQKRSSRRRCTGSSCRCQLSHRVDNPLYIHGRLLVAPSLREKDRKRAKAGRERTHTRRRVRVAQKIKHTKPTQDSSRRAFGTDPM